MPQDPTASPAPGPQPRVALMIDGENISPDLAEPILTHAGSHGKATIRRVYGSATRCPGWQAAPELSFRHAGSHKNAADILLVVEAMDLMLTGAADILVIASSDGDFTHLATHLRERGHTVVGIGEAKAPEGFRLSCSFFVELDSLPLKRAQSKPQPAKPPRSLEKKAVEAVRQAAPQGLPIMSLSTTMNGEHGVKISTLPERNWRAWLRARPGLFDLDPKGPDARVRLRKPA